MSCDLLLYWITHSGEGSWTSFRRAVSQLMSDVPDQNSLARRLRVALSDLWHVDFFVGGSQRWHVCPTMLAGLAADDSVAVLCGSRTPDLLLALKSAETEFDCQISFVESPNGLSQITLRGSTPAMEQVARRVGASFLQRAAFHLLGTVDSIASQSENAPRDEQPVNWDIESFDLDTLTWVKGLKQNAACRFTPRYGSPKFLLHRRHRRLFKLTKREAVYASAMIRGVNLLSYDVERCSLSAPVAAPMPEPLARIACLCTGAQPRIADGTLVYTGIPFDIASALLVAAGQALPPVQESAQFRRPRIG